MKRTDEQKRDFVKECLAIEKAGGDVLGYIEVNWPSYTPRATWYNLQKQFLHCGTENLTEGKPKERISRKEVNDMKKRESQRKMIEGLIEGVKAGNDPKKVLTMLGYTNPACALRNLKWWAKQNDPDLLAALQLISLRETGKDAESANPEPEEEEPVDARDESQEAVETVEFGGKVYEKAEKAEQNAPKTEQKTGDHVSAEEYRQMAGEIRKPEKKPATCCAPSTRKGVTVPDQLPVCAVKSRVKGVWELSGVADCVSLNWENLITHQQCDLGMPAEDWLKLAEEIPVMLRQLGLTN